MRLRLLGRAASAAALVGLLAGAAALPVTAAPARAAAPVHADVAEAGAATAKRSHAASLGLVGLSPAVTRPGDDLTVTVDVHNGTTHAIDDPLVTVTLDRVRDTTRADVTAWTDRSAGDDLGATIGTASTDRLAAGATRRVSVHVAASALLLGTGADVWGPRGLAVALTDGADPTAGPAARLAVVRTFLLWYPVTDATTTTPVVTPVRLGVAVPVTGPALQASDEEETEAAIETATAPGSRLDRVVAATRDTPAVTWAVDPALVAAAARSTDSGARAWADGLCTAAQDRTVYALPVMDPDVAAYAHADTKVPTKDASLTTADCGTSTGTGTGTGDAGTGDAGTGDAGTGDAGTGDAGTGDDDAGAGPPGTPPATSGAGATGGGGAQASGGVDLARLWKGGLAWPATTVPDGETLAAAVSAHLKYVVATPASGALGTAPTALQPTGVVSKQATAAGTATVLAADTDLTRALSGSTVSASDVQLALAVTAVQSRLAADRDTTELLAALPRTWDPDPSAWADGLAAIGAAPWISLTPLDTLAKSSTKGTAERAAPTARHVSSAELAAGSVDALADQRGSVATFATVGTDPAALRSSVTAQLLSPASVAFRQDAELRDHEVQAAVDAATALTAGVRIVPGSDFNLISSSGGLPVTIRNTLDQDATVRLQLTSNDPKLVIESAPTVVVPAHTDRTVRVAVRAVGNGDVRVAVRLATETGKTVTVGDPFDVRVRAGWETVGTWIVLVLLAVAFVAGIWRTVRRGRSSARTTVKESPEAITAGTDISELQASRGDSPDDTDDTDSTDGTGGPAAAHATDRRESEDASSHRDTPANRTR